MSEQKPSMWGELKERKVVQVAILYAIVSWAVVQVADTVTPLLALPEWTARLVLVLLVLNFPIALVMAWGFQITSEGIQRAKPLASSGGHPSRWPFIGGVVAGIVSLTAVAFLLPDGDGAEVVDVESLDENVVAVVPFGFVGPDDLDHMGEGVFYLLAARFDGEIGPRAVDPEAARAHWEEVGGAGSATAGEQVAQRLGAGLVLSGSVVSDPGGMNVNASLRNVVDGSEIAAANARGPADSLAAVVDRLAAGLLSLSTGEYERSLEQLTSTSPDALREYLLGQRELRSARFRRAVEHFRQAVEIDSTFALAALAWGDASNNVPGGAGGSYRLAWRHRDRLSERDRVYLAARLGPRYPDPSTVAERVRAYEEAQRLAPDRATIWYFLGEITFHRPQSRASLEQSRRYFERAIELEPTHGLAISHLTLIDAVRGDLSDLRESLERQAAADVTSPRDRYAAQLAQVAGDSAAFFEALSRGGPGPWVMLSAPELVHGTWAVKGAEQFYASRRDEIIAGSDTYLCFRGGYEFLLELGRPQAAEAILSRWERESGLSAAIELRLTNALYSGLPEQAALEAVRLAEAGLEAEPPSEWGSADRAAALALELWRQSRGDASQSDRTVAQLRESAEASPAARREAVEVSTMLLEALSLERGGDPEGARAALDRMDELMRTGPPNLTTTWYDMLILEQAGLYERLGDPDRALTTLERESAFQFTEPFNMRYWQERGRLRALTGDREGAIQAYRHYLNFRYDPEPELEPEVEGVRRALAELTGG